jgi:hypothetical protein
MLRYECFVCLVFRLHIRLLLISVKDREGDNVLPGRAYPELKEKMDQCGQVD